MMNNSSRSRNPQQDGNLFNSDKAHRGRGNGIRPNGVGSVRRDAPRGSYPRASQTPKHNPYAHQYIVFDPSSQRGKRRNFMAVAGHPINGIGIKETVNGAANNNNSQDGQGEQQTDNVQRIESQGINDSSTPVIGAKEGVRQHPQNDTDVEVNGGAILNGTSIGKSNGSVVGSIQAVNGGHFDQDKSSNPINGIGIPQESAASAVCVGCPICEQKFEKLRRCASMIEEFLNNFEKVMNDQRT